MVEGVGYLLGFGSAVAAGLAFVVRAVLAVVLTAVPEEPLQRPEPTLSAAARRQVEAWPQEPRQPRTRVTYESW